MYTISMLSLRGAVVSFMRRSNPVFKNKIASSPICQVRVPRNDDKKRSRMICLENRF